MSDMTITESAPQKNRGGRKPTPTIGRIVHYVTTSETIRPAIITGLVEEGEVQLVVFNSTGGQFVDSVVISDDRSPGTAFWPKN